MKDERLTKNFSLIEFACHSGEETPDAVVNNIRRLCLTVLQPIRDEWLGPIVITSGWRSATWNAKTGVPKSRHLTGEAADIRPVFLDVLPRFRAMVERMILNGQIPGIGGYGHYPGWLHVDCRPKKPNGQIARWSGAGMGSEVA